MNNDESTPLKSIIIRYNRSPWVQSLTINVISIGIFGLIIRYLQSMGFFPLYSAYALLLTFGFCLPILITIYRLKGNHQDLGFQFTWKGLLFGILIYVPPAIIFIKYQIFFQEWREFSSPDILYAVGLNCWIVFITDAWHHGFLFLGLLKRTNWWIALILENIYWFFYHFDEIRGISLYLGWSSAAVFIILVGVSGDLIAWKFRSVWGLMIGHVLLNIALVIFIHSDIVF